MKGLLLSGGTGSRLRPITHTGPKQLIPVANKPVINYAIEDLKQAGVDSIGVIIGNKGAEEIKQHLGDGSKYGVDITYIMQGNPLGLAHAVGCAKDFIGDDDFVVYLGDNMLKDGIRDLITSFEKGEYGAGIALQEVNNPEQFGIIKTDDDGNVTKLIEKPSDPSTNQAIIGIYIFSPVVFDEIEELDPSWRGELEITDAIQSLVNDGHLIDTHPVTGWWKDTGKPGDILDANRLVLQEQEFKTEGTVEQNAETSGQIHLNPSATIASGAVVRGPVSISEGVKIEKGAYVGPYTSIGKNTKLKNTHIENSVIVGDSDITASVRIVDSLIGRGSKIIDGEENLPEGRRFVVGEHSQIKL